MEERDWISQEKMFWTKNEWNEAFESVAKSNNLDTLNGDQKMNLLIGYLMKEYPVSMRQLQEAKEKYAH